MKLAQLIEWQRQMIEKFGDHDVTMQGNPPGKDQELRIIFHSDGFANRYYTFNNIRIK